MKIEIVEFYPNSIKKEEKFFRGTLHIYIIDYGMDVRGIIAQKNDGKWSFFLPSITTYDDEKNKVRYPVINFTDLALNKELLILIRKQGKEYIKNNFKDIM